MKRSRKRKFRAFVFAVISLLFVGFIIFFLFAGFNFFSKFFSVKKDSSKIISPVIKVNSVFEFEKKLKEKNLQFDKVEVSTKSGSIIGFFPNNLVVFFSQDKDIENQVSSLQLIIQRLTIDSNQLSGENSSLPNGSKKLKTVDLRFDKPIVKF